MQLRRLQLQAEPVASRRFPFPLALVALLALAIGGAPPVGGDPGERPPTMQFGLPMPDGTFLWMHPGTSAPPDPAKGRFRLESGGQRMFRGRLVDVVRYVPRTEEGESLPARDYGQADFVDPATGEVVGGLDGWGKEAFPVEGDRPPPCPRR